MFVARTFSQAEVDANRWLSAFNARLAGGAPISDADRLEVFRRFVDAGCLATAEPLLPALFNLKGRPYTLHDHFPFSPLFRTSLPQTYVLKCGRQVSKSTTQASSGLLFSNSVPNSRTLFVTPLFEQIRRFSDNYVGDFIETSPVRQLWSDQTTNNSVLQRSFKNRSRQIFSFASMNVNRIRGNEADRVGIDEIQDIDRDHLPIIYECMAASKWRLRALSGTPLSLDNTIESVWARSSQAEWVIPCHACGRRNVPAIEHDLDRMIGPYHPDISEARPGTVCANPACGRPIHPRNGRWWHRRPELRWSYAGYHVPQVIMPMHYADPSKWAELLQKRELWGANVFYNEVLGESYDTGSKLCTLSDIKAAACLPWDNVPDAPDPELLRRLNDYPLRVLGVDWGGGGADGVSYTKLALIGYDSGRADVLWGKKLLTPHDHIREAEEILAAIRWSRPQRLAHDYTGAGVVRETVLVQAGLPADFLMPVQYMRTAANDLFRYVKPSDTNPRAHYQADKARSLLYTIHALKLGWMRTFRYDFRGDENPGLLHDFLALVDENNAGRAGAGIYLIGRQAGFSDDFAHAVNLAACASWHIVGKWPDFVHHLDRLRLTPEQVRAAVGPGAPELAELG